MTDGGVESGKDPADGGGSRRAAVLAVAAALAVAAIVVAIVVGQRDGDGATSAPTDASSAPSSPPATERPSPPMSPPSPSDTSSPGEALTVPAYFVADSSAGPRLVREFREASGADAITAAIEVMLGAEPVDPDYRSLWAPGTTVTGARVVGEVVEVDLQGTPSLAPGAGDAGLAVQQLVYTATAAAASAGATDGALPVLVRVDGRPVERLFDTVDASRPLQRASELDVRQLVQLNNPGEGTTHSGPVVVVDGEAAAFEATVAWEVRADGAVVDAGSATATECCRLAPFSFEVELAPGTYEILVSETDPSDGEGRAPMSDSKSFTVR